MKIKNLLENEYFIFLLRLSFGLFFIYAAITKISYPAEFAQAIRAYNIIPDSLSTLPAIFLPWIELFCGAFLIAGIFVKSSAQISIGLLALFTVNVLIAMVRGLDIDCGCGLSIAGIEKVGWGKIVENIFLILFLIFLSKRKSCIFSVENKIFLRK